MDLPVPPHHTPARSGTRSAATAARPVVFNGSPWTQESDLAVLK